MNLYEIQQKANEYIRSIELLPTIRERIFLAINDICGATPDGKDWSFLKTSFSIERDNASTDTRLVFKAPSNLRSLIEVVSLGGISFDSLIADPYNYYIEWNGREIIIERESDDEPFPSGNLVILAYQTHPSILVQDSSHTNPTWATEWTPSYPPASAVLLPDEAADLVFDATMLRLRDFETEVYFSIEKAEARVQTGLKNLLTNYALQIYPLNPPATPSVEWLVAVGTNQVGGEKYQNQLLAFVNELAGDFADIAKVQLSDRPSPILKVSKAELPKIKGISIPAQYWSAGMIFKVASFLGTLNQPQIDKWELSKREWADNFYAIDVQSSNFNLSTFGGLVKYIQTQWKSCRDDHQAWTMANEVVADVMSRVNTDALIASKTYNLVVGQKDYTLPSDLKTIIKVEIDGKEIVGRSFTARGKVIPNMTEYQYLQYPTQQAFRLVGANIALDVAPSNTGTLTIWYYKSHEWTSSPSASVVVDPLLIIKAIQAKVAIEEGQSGKASYYQNEFEKAIVQYNNNQYRNYPADDRVINATPSVNRRILAAYD